MPGVRDLARSKDVGVVELGPCRRGPIEQWTVVELSGRAAVIPSVQTRAWHWIAHDLLKEGDLLARENRSQASARPRRALLERRRRLDGLASRDHEPARA